MAPDHDTEALEALARGDALRDRGSLEAHVAACDACAQELAWLRAERRLVHERPADGPPLDALWSDVAARLPAPRPTSASPYRVAAPPPSTPGRRPWGAFAAGFAAAVVLGAGVAALTLRFDRRPLVARRASSQAPAPTESAVPVTGPVTLRVETWSADVRVVGEARGELRATVHGVDVTPRIRRRSDGRYDVVFDGQRLASGAVEVLAPAGSEVEVSTGSGDVVLGGSLGDVRVTSTAGDVEASAGGAAEVTTASGDVVLRVDGGRARVRTVSGNVRVEHLAAAPEVDLVSASGDLTWSGTCRRGCRLDARAVSGDVRLALGSDSGFTLRFSSTSGRVSDGFSYGAAARPQGRVGSGEGGVTVATTSGDLSLVPAVLPVGAPGP